MRYVVVGLCITVLGVVGGQSRSGSDSTLRRAEAVTTVVAAARAGVALAQGVQSPTTSPVNAPHKGLRGFFLQVDSDYDVDHWKGAVAEIAALGANVIVISTESYLNKDFTRDPVSRVFLDAILAEAKAKGIAVHIGLAFPPWANGATGIASDEPSVENLIRASKTSLDILWERYADYARDGTWVGCYLSSELWTPRVRGELGFLTAYVRDVAAYVKMHSEPTLQVSMSPFINTDPTDDAVSATQADYADLFEHAEVDLVALQDGIGARDLPAERAVEQLPFYRAMQAACVAHCQVWANVESFAGTAPAPWARLKTQMEALARDVPNQISFEYGRYWYASGPANAVGKQLRDAYAAWRDSQ